MNESPRRLHWLLYQQPGSLVQELKRPIFWLVLIAMIPISDWLGRNVMLEPAANWYSDWLLRQRERRQERFTRIVRIDPDDHRKAFDARLPLRSDALRNVVFALLRQGPAVLVIDLDTSQEQEFRSFQILHTGRVVWARDAVYVPGNDGLKLRADPVLGGHEVSDPPYGIALMPNGFDGRVGSWLRFYTIDGTPRPTLVWRAVQEYCRNVERRTGCPPPNELDAVEATPRLLTRDIDSSYLSS